MKNSHTFAKFVIELVALTVKNVQLGENADTFMPIFCLSTSNISKIRTGNPVYEKCTLSYLKYKVNRT